MKRNETQRPSEEEAIEATAAAWLAQRDDGLSREDETAFARWRAEDGRHEAAVARLEGAWASLRQLRDFRPEASCHPDRDLLARPRRAMIFAFPSRAIALAAVAALAVTATWWTLRPAAHPMPGSIYATTVGGYQRVILGDGSVLELNGNTLVTVQFTQAERRVQLARGEAHFTVAKNAARPFWVEAGTVAVRAVGTAFNVRLGAKEVEVLVTEGKVAVSEVERVDPTVLSEAAEPKIARRSQRVPPPDTLLAANERALIPTAVASTALPVVEKISVESVRDALAWQGSRLVFVDTPLPEVVAQFNRRNVVQLSIAEPALMTLPVGGSFRAENVEAFVRLLESGDDVVAERPDPTHIVLRRAK